jgi:hypothetical protein
MDVRYNDLINTTQVHSDDVIYVILWPIPEMGVHTIATEVYVRRGAAGWWSA